MGEQSKCCELDWEKDCEDIGIERDDKIIICGGKNVGKSSLIRHIINKNLLKGTHSKLLYVDCDPGQTELTSPGVVSVVMIDGSHKLSWPKDNIKHYKPLLACSVGAISVAPNLQFYIQCISQLNKFCREYEGSLPIMINTMGWTQDIGMFLLSDIIKMFNPTQLIQIEHASDSMRNFKYQLNVDKVSALNGIKYNGKVRYSKLHYKLINVTSMVSSGQAHQAKQNRIEAQMAYMTNIPSIAYQPILAIKPYRIPWSQIHVHVVNAYPINPLLVMDILNSSWIHLCSIKPQLLASQKRYIEDVNGVKVMEHLVENVYLGSAILRNIDMSQKCLYIITPESPWIINQVNCIIRPDGLYIPDSYLHQQKHYSTQQKLPYIHP